MNVFVSGFEGQVASSELHLHGVETAEQRPEFLVSK
jgi:hypothetical protein